jgi:hypothetical protein
LLLDLKRRGLAMAPELAVADGALGFWQAVEEVWPKTRGQRCWVHKTANVLNKLPKSQHSEAKRALQESQHSEAKRALQEIWMAETKNDALTAFDVFVETWGVKYDKAVECLIKDRAALLAFYDFPAEHWKHLRTTNVIESSFATIRHRTVRSTRDGGRWGTVAAAITSATSSPVTDRARRRRPIYVCAACPASRRKSTGGILVCVSACNFDPLMGVIGVQN